MGDGRSEIVQGTLDMMVLQTLDVMGALHGYGLARRIEQVSGDALRLNQGTIYAALLRAAAASLDPRELGHVGKQPAREVLRHHESGQKQLAAETEHWQRITDVIGRLLRLAER